MNSIQRAVLIFILIIFMTITLHWLLIHLYISLCAPRTVYGFITSTVTLGSPLCQFINYIQFELAKHYIHLWAGAAIAIITFITTRFTTYKINAL